MERLEALLGEAREMRKLQTEIEADVVRLMEAGIRDVFDRTNTSWRTSLISDEAIIQTGTANGRRFGDRKTLELPYLRGAIVQAGALVLDEIKTIAIAEDEVERYLPRSTERSWVTFRCCIQRSRNSTGLWPRSAPPKRRLR